MRQYTALLATEGVTLEITGGALAEVARLAHDINARSQDIGARRLHTVLERLLDEVSFDASEGGARKVIIDVDEVKKRLHELVKDEDLSRYIL